MPANPVVLAALVVARRAGFLGLPQLANSLRA